MLEDMAVRRLGEKTRHDYTKHVETFTRFLGRSPDTATGEDLRRFQVHELEAGGRPPKMNAGVGAAVFLRQVARSSRRCRCEAFWAAFSFSPTAAPRLVGCSNASHQLSSRRSQRDSLVDLDCAGLDTRDQLATELGRVGNRMEAADQKR